MKLRTAMLCLIWTGCDLVADIGEEPYADCVRRPNHPRCDRRPTVAITSPASGATVDGTVLIDGTASDDRLVARVEIAVDGGAPAVASGTTDWGFSLDTTALADGAHMVTARALDSAGQSSSASISLTVQNGNSDIGGYGPQPDITCPATAVNISPGQDIPSIVAAHPAGTSFCVLAGTYSPTSPINLKTNQKLIGQYGAIIDGTNVRMTYDIGSTSIVRGWNCGGDCSGATVQNLFLRNLTSGSCIGVYSTGSDNWTIDHNEVSGCSFGINVGINSGAQITNNFMHHNVGDGSPHAGGYGSYQGRNMLFSHNQIAYNGHEQKVSVTQNVTFRDNWVHHNDNGIWYDGDNLGSLIEGNVVEDNSGEGIFYEVSGAGIIRDNLVSRNGSSGIFISTSRDVQISGNTLEDNFRGVNFFVNCDIVGPPDFPYPGSIGLDLRDNYAHDNTILVPDRTDAFGSSMSYISSCTPEQVAPYESGAKNLVFEGNDYTVPSLSVRYWVWADRLRSFAEWQSLGHDLQGTIRLR